MVARRGRQERAVETFTHDGITCPIASWKSYKPREISRLATRQLFYPNDVAAVIREVCGVDFESYEHFVLIGVDNEYKVVAVADGTSLHPSACGITTMDLVAALFKNVEPARKISGVIMGHNHPSGNVTPSEDDVRMMKVFLCQAEFIPLIDHVIVGPNHHNERGYHSFSMRDRFGSKLFVGPKCRLDVDISAIVGSARP